MKAAMKINYFDDQNLIAEQQKKYAEEFYPAEIFYINKKSEIASLKVEPVEKSKAKEAKNKDLER